MQDKRSVVEHIRSINSQLNMRAVLGYYDIEFDDHGGNDRFKVKCTFHDDSNPSMQIFTDNESGQDSWWCPVCNENGDCFRFIQMMTKEYKESLNVAQSIIKGGTGGSVSNPRYKAMLERQRLRKKVYLFDYKLGVKYRDWLISLEDDPKYIEACIKVDEVFKHLDRLVEAGQYEQALEFIREKVKKLRNILIRKKMVD